MINGKKISLDFCRNQDDESECPLITFHKEAESFGKYTILEYHRMGSAGGNPSIEIGWINDEFDIKGFINHFYGDDGEDMRRENEYLLSSIDEWKEFEIGDPILIPA